VHNVQTANDPRVYRRSPDNGQEASTEMSVADKADAHVIITLRALLRTARPKQWTKNVLVVAAPGAAGLLTHLPVLLHTALAFAALCLAASGTYFINDASDIEADRKHPTKCRRPIAAGLISVRTGRVTGYALLAGGIAVAAATGRWQFVLAVLFYVVLTTCYSIWLKHIAVVDVLAVAAGFLLRAIGGGAASGIPLSNWFLIVASFGSFFMVVGKRHAEHRMLANSPDGHVRPVMMRYTESYLGYLRSVSSSAVLLSYCLFAFERAQLHGGRFPWFQLSIGPFAAGILRYALLLDGGEGENPEDLVLADRALLAAGLAWVTLFALGTYFGG
jgi:decaprenyl-phosphate phosphoribosyltransferase